MIQVRVKVSVIDKPREYDNWVLAQADIEVGALRASHVTLAQLADQIGSAAEQVMVRLSSHPEWQRMLAEEAQDGGA